MYGRIRARCRAAARPRDEFTCFCCFVVDHQFAVESVLSRTPPPMVQSGIEVPKRAVQMAVCLLVTIELTERAHAPF